MNIYKLTYEEVERYASHVLLSDIQRLIREKVLPNFTDWFVTVIRYYTTETRTSDFQYEIKFYNKVEECYYEILHNNFSEIYFRNNIYNFNRRNDLTRAQIKYYIDHLSVDQTLIDKLRSYNDDSYLWKLTFDPNDSLYDWNLNVIHDTDSIYEDRIMFERGLEILNVHELPDVCESNSIPTSDAEKVVSAPRSHEGVWYLSKRQLRNYYDNMSTYSRKVEQAIHDYDNYCVRIEKNDDVYTLIIDRMQPDIVRNYYSATINIHTFNIILGINEEPEPVEDTSGCDSDEEPVDNYDLYEEFADEEDPVRESDSDEEEVEDRSMSDGFGSEDTLFTVVNGQLRRLLLRDEFNRFRTTLFCSTDKEDEIYNNYNNFSVFIIKDGSDHYSIIADKLNPSIQEYFRDGFGSDSSLARYFGQDFVNKFNEVCERISSNINTARPTVDWHGILRNPSRQLPENFTLNYRDVPCRLLSKEEFEQYATNLNGGMPLHSGTTVSKIYNNYNNYNVYITRERSLYGSPFKLTANRIHPWKEDFWLDGFSETDLVTFFGEEFAHQVKDTLPEQSDLVHFDGRLHSAMTVPNMTSYANAFCANDRYHRYLTKDEFKKYVNHLTGSDTSIIKHILEHYANYISYISKETSPVGSPYTLNVIDATTHNLYYWDGFSDVALEGCFGIGVARDVRALDSIDNISTTPGMLFTEQYMQRPAAITIADDTPMPNAESSNATCGEEPVSDEIRTIDQLVVALDKLRQQRIENLDDSNVACASNMDRHEQYDYDDHIFNDNLLVNIDNLINSLNIIRRRSDM